MSVSSTRLTAMQTTAGNLSSQNEEKGLCGVNTVTTWRWIQARQWLMTGDSWALKTDMTSHCLTHFPSSVALGVTKDKKQGHPSTGGHLVPLDSLQSQGRLMTHWVHRGIPGILASNTERQHKDMCTHLSKALKWHVYEYRHQQI